MAKVDYVSSRRTVNLLSPRRTQAGKRALMVRRLAGQFGLALLLYFALFCHGLAAASTFQLPLVKGWNLISLPLIPTDAAVGTVFTQAGILSAWKWDKGAWKIIGADETMLWGQGVWVNSADAGQLALTGEVVPYDVLYALTTGWNLVGVKGMTATTVAAVAASTLIMDNSSQYDPSAKIISVWKWKNSGWAVNLPGEGDKGAAYAASKGFALFTDINPGEGFWVQAAALGATPELPPLKPGDTGETTTTTSLPVATTTSSTTTGTIATTTSTAATTTTTSTTTGAGTTTTTIATETTIALSQGWNLVSSRLPIEVAGTFANPAAFTSVWKWQSGVWAVYLAGEAEPGSYAASKGFLPLSTIEPGEGVWVNAQTAGALTPQGEATAATTLPLAQGWNLKGLLTPDQVTAASVFANTMPLVASVWKWQSGTWAVLLPGENEAGAYAAGKGFLPLTVIDPGAGFWVNCTAATEIPLATPAVANTAQALGPLAEAEAAVYALTDLTTPLATASSDGQGLFPALLSGGTSDRYVLVRISGGQDLDADADGITDTTATDNAGPWHALLTAKEFVAGGFKVSLLTNIAWQFTKNMVAGATPTAIAQRLDAVAKVLIAEDIDGDGVVTGKDLLAFNPGLAAHQAKLAFAYQSLLTPDGDGNSVISALHANQEATLLTLLQQLFGSQLSLFPSGLPNLGAIAYTTDTALKASTTYSHDGNPAVVSVTDSQGYIWTLTIPYGALPWPETITMTPFATIDTSNSIAKVKSGVRLEPDGLRFDHEVTLSVTPPNNGAGVGLIFAMAQDGSTVRFAPTSNEANSVSAPIFHFSSAAYDPGADDMAGYRNWAEQGYQLAVDAAKQFLQQGAPTPPEPLAVCPYCRGTEANQDHGEYYEYSHAFLEPYADILAVLLPAAKNLALLGSEVDTSEGLELAKQITTLAWSSILGLGAEYQGESPPERLIALLKTAVEVARQVQLLGGEAAPETLAPWAKTIRDYYFDQLKEQHDYRAWPLVVELQRNYLLLGGADDGFLDALTKALTFEVVWENTFTVGPSQVTQKADLKTLELKLEQGWWWSEITFDYTGGAYTPGYPLVLPLSLTSEVTMWNWDPCVSKTVDLVQWGTFGLVNEVYSGIEYPQGVAGSATSLAYASRLVQGNPAGFMFTVPLQNHNATLGDQEFSGSGAGGNATATSHITITHTPK